MRRLNGDPRWPTKRKTGFLSLTLFLLFLAIGLPQIAKGEDSNSILRVDASTSLGVFNNMAGGINFWGEREAQQRFIDEVGTDLYRIKVRLHEVQKVGESYTNFPFTADAVSKGLDIPDGEEPRVMIQIYGIPYWLSTSKDTRFFSNNLPNYAKYPPQDFEEWAKVVSAAIAKLKDLGLEKIDYYEIFGEPNIGSTWYQQTMHGEPNELGHNTVEVMQNFYKIYEYTALGIKAVDPDAKIGGVAISPILSGMWWTRFLCQEARSRNLPLDFYSWHSYKADEKLAPLLDPQVVDLGALTEDMVQSYFGPIFERQGFNTGQIDTMVRDMYYYAKSLDAQGLEAIRYPYSFYSSQIKSILIEEGFGEAELLLTEWNVSGFYDERHDTHYGASFIIRGLIDLTDSFTEAQTFYSLSPSDYDPNSPKYRGRFPLFAGSTPKPSFNAFKSFAMLGDDNDRISVESSDSDIYFIATKDQNGISLLATYYVMSQYRSLFPPVKKVTVEIGNIPFDQYSFEIYLVDENHSNDFFGSGPELELIGQGTGSHDSSSDFTISGYLGIYGVVLIKINKIQS
ncbi:MAG: hypothetical protein GTN76_16485 [Candidatus Aenigmarchaeota archaeon]|nr:hypothetical protein [Candidatus Aenigmarchaeota archaeon]